MEFPENLRYTAEHEWIQIEEGETAVVGITDYAQSELGDIVFVDIETEGQALEANAIFGTIEAVKTVSDLFLPIAGTIIEVNDRLAENPELVNKDPYGDGWLIKMSVYDVENIEDLMTYDQYQALVGQ